jgi:hypothetical protein
MTAPQSILQSHYSQGKAITDVEIVVFNPMNSRQVSFKKKVQIDTGFDSGVHMRELDAGELATIGVNPPRGSVTLAGNVPAQARYCVGYLQKIGDYSLPSPGIPITVVFQGTTQQGLLGLEAIRNWVVEFDGPRQAFKVSS